MTQKHRAAIDAMNAAGEAEKIDVQANKAADAVGVTPYSDMRPFVVQAVKYALCSLPAIGEGSRVERRDAPEPVGYGYEPEMQSGKGGFWVSREESNTYDTPVYVASPPSDGDLVRLREALEAILLCHKEGGLLDSVDNDGEHYTSQALIDAIAKARAALSAKEPGHE